MLKRFRTTSINGLLLTARSQVKKHHNFYEKDMIVRYRCHHRHHPYHPHRRHPSQMSLDRLELSVDGGRVKIFVQIGHYDKTLIIGQVIVVVIMAAC